MLLTSCLIFHVAGSAIFVAAQGCSQDSLSESVCTSDGHDVVTGSSMSMLQLGSSQSAGKAAGIQSVLLHRFDVPAAKANSAKMGPVEEKHTELHDSSYLVALNQESEKVVKTSPARNLAAAKNAAAAKKVVAKKAGAKKAAAEKVVAKNKAVAKKVKVRQRTATKRKTDRQKSAKTKKHAVSADKVHAKAKKQSHAKASGSITVKLEKQDKVHAKAKKQSHAQSPEVVQDDDPPEQMTAEEQRPAEVNALVQDKAQAKEKKQKTPEEIESARQWQMVGYGCSILLPFLFFLFGNPIGGNLGNKHDSDKDDNGKFDYNERDDYWGEGNIGR
jgi:hypothetical protein